MGGRTRAIAAAAAAAAAVLVVTAVLTPAASAGGIPVQLTRSRTTIWAATDSGLHALDPLTGRLQSLPRTTYRYATHVVAGDGAAWIASIRNGYTAGAVDRLDLKTRRTTLALRAPHQGIYGLAYAAHSIWVLLARPVQPLRFEVARLDTHNGTLRYFTLGGDPGWIAASADGLWISGDHSLRLMHRNGSVSRIGSVADPGLLTITGGSVWVSSRHSLQRLDEHSHHRLTTLHLEAPTSALTAAAGRLWVSVAPASGAFSRLLRINAHTGRITARLALSRSPKKPIEPTSIAADRTHVWLGYSSSKAGTQEQKILRLNARSLARERVIALK